MPAPAAASTASVVVLPQPQSPPLTRPSVNSATPAVTNIAPTASGGGASWPGTCGRRRHPTTSATTPIGTLTKNTQRQSAATSSPPTTGPSAAARPPTAV